MKTETYLGLTRNDRLLFVHKEIAGQPVMGNRCNKSDCYFCERVLPRPIAIKKVKTRFVPDKLQRTPWTTEETQILLKNINRPTSEILKVGLLPGRRKTAIDTRKSNLRKKYNIKTLLRNYRYDLAV